MSKLKSRLETARLARVKARPHTPLSESRPRTVRLTAAGACLMGLSLAALGAAIPMGAWMFSVAERQRNDREAFRRDAMVTAATVSELTRTRGEDSKYYAHYQFEAGGRVYEGRGTISRGRWRNLKKGSPIDVVYLPLHPQRSSIRGRERNGMPIWLGPAMALILLGAGAAMLVPIVRERKLLSEGRVASGHVTGTKKLHDGHHVDFEFRLLSGAVRKGKYGPVSAAPAQGEQVEIIYDPDNPGHYSRLPLALVKETQKDVLGR